jgi:hypothetical protein
MGRINGLDKLQRRLMAIGSPKAEKRIEAALHDVGELIATDAQISITTGAVSGRNHVPSKPGEAPNNDTGVLAGGIEVNPSGRLEVTVGSYSDHAFIEFPSSKMAARPYMRPARDRNRKEAKRRVGAAFSQIVKGAAD